MHQNQRIYAVFSNLIGNIFFSDRLREFERCRLIRKCFWPPCDHFKAQCFLIAKRVQLSPVFAITSRNHNTRLSESIDRHKILLAIFRLFLILYRYPFFFHFLLLPGILKFDVLRMEEPITKQPYALRATYLLPRIVKIYCSSPSTKHLHSVSDKG